jgi:hypothetical protein
MAHQVTQEQLPEELQSNDGTIDTPTVELLASWRLQDATDDAAVLRAAERDLGEFKQAMNENRTRAGEPKLYY